MKKIFLFCLFSLFFYPFFAQKTNPVQFEWGKEILPDNFTAVSKNTDVTPDEIVGGRFVRYVQFGHTLHAGQRMELENAGIQVLNYVFPATYLLSIPEQYEYKQLEKFDARSIVALKPQWKMAKTLREPPFGAWAVHGEFVDLDIQVLPNISIAEGARLCREKGITVLMEGNQNGFLEVRTPQAKLLEVAALPFIQYMEVIAPPSERDDVTARTLHRSNLLDSDSPLGLKFNGEGVRTLVRDDGPVGPHVDFHGRLDNLGTQPAATDINHADWVAGAMAGAGNVNPLAKGMAAAADVFVLPYINNFQDQTLPLHLNEGVTITNTSYSDGCNIGYTVNSQTVDKQLFEHPTLMHVFSAGNSNGNDCGYGAGNQWGNITGGHKMAKNAIAVANVLADGSIQVNSSRGPAYDGRLKPEISAFGTDALMTQPNNTYSLSTGTSFSSPFVAGCLAQLTQVYKAANGSQEPKGTLLKAAVLNTANDLGVVGPDFIFGWGHINTWSAAQLLQNNRFLANQVDEGGEMVHFLDIPGGTRLARFMIVWSDPQASPSAARALVNDLDLSLVGPDGVTVFLPWKQNTTPNAVLLASPAGKGRDSLNNVEQVAIENPVGGLYRVVIKGTDVPLGPQEYQLVWKFDFEDVTLTYPAGGEGLVAGNTERISWDAYGNLGSFILDYTTDGLNFTSIGTVAGDKRFYDWTVPSIVTGNCYIRITRGSEFDAMDHPLSIVPVPSNVHVEKVCPDSMTIAWDNLSDTLNYDVYLLGSRFMEIKATVDTNYYSFPISNGGLAQWMSVRASHPNGMAGLRSIAVQWPGGLKNCPQQFDLGVRTLLQPAGEAIVSCTATEQPVTVRVVNEGLNTISGALMHYQVNNDPVVTEMMPDLQPDSVLVFTFSTAIPLTQNGLFKINVWSEFLQDATNFNDTLHVDLPVITQAKTGLFVEDFQAGAALPLGWTVINPDNGITWAPSQPTIVGRDGNNTRAYFVNHYQYATTGEKDNLYMIPVKLDSASNPALVFDMAHQQYDPSYNEQLVVELYPDCDLAASPVVLFDKTDPDLATTANGTTLFTPDNANDWRHYNIDLSAYAGHAAVIRFVAVNDYGNNTYVDNIGIGEYHEPVFPIAEILNSGDTICRMDTAVFAANVLTPDTQYSWSFGLGALPGTATGSGPHHVYYPTPGAKNVRLIAVNAIGGDTTIQQLTVLPFPTPNFTQVANNLVVTFTNTSANGLSYLWDFGDGTTSTEKNPVHTYASPGAYQVVMSVTNACKTNVKTVTLTLTSGVRDLLLQAKVDVLPNPTAGDFMIQIEGRENEEMRIALFDSQGKLIKTEDVTIKQGVNSIPFEGLHLPKGMYQLQLTGASGVAMIAVAVQ